MPGATSWYGRPDCRCGSWTPSAGAGPGAEAVQEREKAATTRPPDAPARNRRRLNMADTVPRAARARHPNQVNSGSERPPQRPARGIPGGVDGGKHFGGLRNPGEDEIRNLARRLAADIAEVEHGRQDPVAHDVDVLHVHQVCRRHPVVEP